MDPDLKKSCTSLCHLLLGFTVIQPVQDWPLITEVLGGASSTPPATSASRSTWNGCFGTCPVSRAPWLGLVTIGPRLTAFGPANEPSWEENLSEYLYWYFLLPKRTTNPCFLEHGDLFLLSWSFWCLEFLDIDFENPPGSSSLINRVYFLGGYVGFCGGYLLKTERSWKDKTTLPLTNLEKANSLFVEDKKDPLSWTMFMTQPTQLRPEPHLHVEVLSGHPSSHTAPAPNEGIHAEAKHQQLPRMKSKLWSILSVRYSPRFFLSRKRRNKETTCMNMQNVHRAQTKLAARCQKLMPQHQTKFTGWDGALNEFTGGFFVLLLLGTRRCGILLFENDTMQVSSNEKIACKL